jgi:hypothetical protein
MFRFHDALDPSFHLAGLLFPEREEQTRQVGTKESEPVFDNGYNLVRRNVPSGSRSTLSPNIMMV